MELTKIFRDGNTQTIKLPKDCMFDGDVDDEKSIGVGSSGSGCNIGVNAALIMLAGISLMTFRRRIR